MQITFVGYDYLREKEKPVTASSIFKSNTILHPNSANVFDSYAECLMINGDVKSSIANFQKAVNIASENGSEDLEYYKENLENAKNKMKP